MDTETNCFLYRYAIIVPMIPNVINDQGNAHKMPYFSQKAPTDPTF